MRFEPGKWMNERFTSAAHAAELLSAFFQKHWKYFLGGWLLLFTALLYFHVIYPHAHFRTTAYDLGFFNQAMWQWAHFQIPSSSYIVKSSEVPNVLGDHFSLLLPLNSMLYWIFGSYALLVVNVIYSIVCAIGIFKLTALLSDKKSWAFFAVILFTINFSFWTAITFDYHDYVVGALMFPWVMYFFYMQQWKYFYPVLILFLFAREDMAVISGAWAAGAMIFDRKIDRKHAAAALAASGIWFILVMKVLMPRPESVDGYIHWAYTPVGKDFTEVIYNLIHNHDKVFNLFFDNLDKLILWRLMLFSGGILLFYQPRFLLPVMAVMAMKTWSDNWSHQQIYFHYHVWFAIFIPITIALVIPKIKKAWVRIIPIVFFLWTNLYYLDLILLPGAHKYLNFTAVFHPSYYQPRPNHRQIVEAIELIPEDVSLTCIHTIAPHLSFRDSMYVFQREKEGEYILLNLADSVYAFPFVTPQESGTAMRNLIANENYITIYDEKGVVVRRRKHP